MSGCGPNARTNQPHGCMKYGPEEIDFRKLPKPE
jgi:hypothetical protein